MEGGREDVKDLEEEELASVPSLSPFLNISLPVPEDRVDKPFL